MPEQSKIKRRTFFAALGGAAAAGIAAKIASKTEVPLATAPKEPAGTGYRLSEHIKKYYRTTTI
ncbi:MAG TPA: hypothetical protein VIM12_03550 [Noviherbaspirillum sp.]|jgi:hypothetical protein|uniref:hypothetical protein n=1 Tax=Noviherbaspirillum sp. TaxID=1926288 RepID=UPI002F934264